MPAGYKIKQASGWTYMTTDRTNNNKFIRKYTDTYSMLLS